MHSESTEHTASAGLDLQRVSAQNSCRIGSVHPQRQDEWKPNSTMGCTLFRCFHRESLHTSRDVSLVEVNRSMETSQSSPYAGKGTRASCCEAGAGAAASGNAGGEAPEPTE